MAGYGDDLAWIHETGFATLARNGATAAVALLRRAGITDGLVVELGCGGGTSAEVMTGAGYDVWGIDLSPAMVRLARDRVPSGRFVVGSLYDAEFPRCVAVAAIGEVLNYAFTPQRGRRTHARLFERVYDAILPGGLFVFDIAGPGRAPQNEPVQRHVSGPDWTVLTETKESADGKWLERRIVSFRRTGRLYRRNEEVHRIRLHRAAELATPLRGCGFRVAVPRGYDGVPFAPGHRVLVARRP